MLADYFVKFIEKMDTAEWRSIALDVGHTVIVDVGERGRGCWHHTRHLPFIVALARNGWVFVIDPRDRTAYLQIKKEFV